MRESSHFVLPNINGYDFSFRNSVSAKNQSKSARDHQLFELQQTPEFEKPKPTLRDSQQTFGRRSRSHLQLTSISKLANHIGKIEINFNNFTPQSKPHYTGQSQPRSFSSQSKRVKTQLAPMSVQDIYTTRIRENFMKKTREHLKTEVFPPPETILLPEQILAKRADRRLVRGREFNRKLMLEKRIQNSRLRLPVQKI